MEIGNARFVENGKISGNDESRKVNLEKIRVDIPPPFPTQDIVVPQPIQQVEGNEQHYGNDSPLHKDITTKNNVESLQSAVLRKSQQKRRPAISYNYMVYLQESDFDIGINKDSISFSKTI